MEITLFFLFPLCHLFYCFKTNYRHFSHSHINAKKKRKKAYTLRFTLFQLATTYSFDKRLDSNDLLSVRLKWKCGNSFFSMIKCCVIVTLFHCLFIFIFSIFVSFGKKKVNAIYTKSSVYFLLLFDAPTYCWLYFTQTESALCNMISF